MRHYLLLRKLWTTGLLLGIITKGLAQPYVMHISIDAEIDTRTHRYLRLGLEEAEKQEAKLVILELNTYGGELSYADKMRQLLLSSKRPVFAFINKNAASAGALIAIACDSIYMTEGASIGAATVVTTLGEAAPDKYQSYMRGIMRSTAETRGRNTKLSEAMVDPDVVVDSLAPLGKVLTLSTQQAIKYGFCEAKTNSFDQLLLYLNLQDKEVVRYEPSSVEKVIAFFINPTVSALLITIIILGIYGELKTPGLGFPALAAVVAAMLYLVPYYLHGLAANWEIFVLLVGLSLVVLEIFVLPGFGLAGISGTVLIVGALLLVMLDNELFDFSLVPIDALREAATVVLVAILGGGVLLLVVGKQLLNTKAFRRLTLPNNMDPNKGYRVSSSEKEHSLLGKIGEVHTVLRPSGKIKIEDQVYEATSATSDYVSVGTSVEVVSEEGRELRVIKK